MNYMQSQTKMEAPMLVQSTSEIFRLFLYGVQGLMFIDYRDRFRTLQFNLSKPDCVVILQRILSGSLSAKEISVMSSTDLAD